MTEADRALIRQRVAAEPCLRIVITHGTDTMTETARELLGSEGKTIVLTGAMQPARFRESDAVFNIGMAVGAAQSLPPGVYIAMNGRIFDPQRTRKNVAGHRFEEVEKIS
jgi:L-asparaginase